MRLYGKRPVIERLKSSPQTIRKLYLEQGLDLSDVVRAAQAAKCPFVSVPKTTFSKWTREIHAQGVIAEVEAYRYAPFSEILSMEPRPTLVLLDRVTDPQNLGAILRTTACLGGFALVLPKHDSAEVNETVLRVACGGENYVPVAQVTNLVQACEQAKEKGYWIAGMAVEGGRPLASGDWPEPLGVVFGSEGGGIRPGLTKHLELTLTVPMPGAKLSFNVATAVALAAYEIARRRSLQA